MPLIIIAYLLTRLINLTLIPIFMDESNYLDWGWRMLHSERHFHSLYDAKQPLLMWLFGLAQMFPGDPLFNSRFVSVFTGLLTLIGLYKLSKSYWPCILYICIPIFLFFDRQALMESSLSAMAVWGLIFLFRLLEKPNFKNAIYLGLILGVGFFIKSTALLFIVTVLLLLISKKHLWRNATLSLAVIGTILLVNLPLLLQPEFWQTLSFTSRYSLSLFEVLHFPVFHWLEILLGNINIAFWFLTPPVFILALINFKKLGLYFWLPLIIFSLTARSTNFRYLMPFLPLICLVVPKFKWLLILPTIISLLLIFNPLAYFRLMAKFTKYSYIEGYVTGDSTGYQVMNTIAKLKEFGADQKIYVAFALNVGNPEAAVIVYLRHHPNILTTYLDARLFGKSLDNVDCLVANKPIYFLARNEQQGGLNKYFGPVTTVTNIYNSDYHTIYTLKKNCTGKSFMLTGNSAL